MKILIVSQYFWPEEFRINDICKGFIEMGHHVDVLTGLPNYPFGSFYKDYSFFKRGSKYYEGARLFRSFLIPRGKNSNIKLALNYISFMVNSLFHIPRLLFNKYDAVFMFQTSPITSAISAIILSKIKRIPSTIYIQDLWPETFYSIISIENKTIRNILDKICAKIYSSFNMLLIASKGYKDILSSKGIDESKIVYFPQWAENLYLNNEDNEKDIYKSEKDFIITFAGNIGKAQSVETIVEAARLCQDEKNIKWRIIGDGSEFSNIKQLVDKYDLKDTVQLLGRKPVKEMPYYFAKSDALVVTLRDSDILRITLPAKVQSYMASGKPILAALSGEGMNVINESKCGLACEAEDYEMLYRNVLKLYSMSEKERKIMGKNGKDYFIENFERAKLLDKLEKLLKAMNAETIVRGEIDV